LTAVGIDIVGFENDHMLVLTGWAATGDYAAFAGDDAGSLLNYCRASHGEHS
jgi:hypothetical protein